MPSIFSNVVQPAPKPAVKVEVPASAQHPTRSQRSEGFEQMLRDVRGKQSAPAEQPTQKPAARAAEKADKSAKAHRTSRSERNEASKATQEAAENESIESASQAGEAAAAKPGAEAEEANQAAQAAKKQAAAHAKGSEQNQAECETEITAEDEEAPVQPTGDATQQQGQPGQYPSDESELPVKEIDDAPEAAAPQEMSTDVELSAQLALSAATTPSQQTPTELSPAPDPTSPAPKATVSAIGGAAPKQGGDVASSEQNGANAADHPTTAGGANTPATPALESNEALETLQHPASPSASTPNEKVHLEPVAGQEPVTASAPSTPTLKTSAPEPAALPREAQFAGDNHEKIVTGVRTQLTPDGGTMRIRLDPPELGALQIMVQMRNGALTATFQTSNDDATQLLSHSLNQLKHMLEAQGMNVDKLQVQQAPKSEAGQPKGDDQQNPQQQAADDHAARQEQQRKEMLKRMWRRASGIADPIDFTA